MRTSLVGARIPHAAGFPQWIVAGEQVMDDFPSAFRAANAVAYGAGVFVIVGAGYRIMYSSDFGATWIPATHNSIRTFTDVHFAAGLFVAVGNNGVCYTSTDGITWTSRTSQFNTGTFNDNVMYGGGTWLVFQTGSGRIYTSPDGTTWTENTVTVGNLPFANFSTPQKTLFANGLFFAVGSSRISTSTTGLVWTIRHTHSTEVEDIAYNAADNVFLAVCWDNIRLTSTNGGTTWSSIGGILGRGTQNMNCIQYLNGEWATAWEDSYIDESSNNGATWPRTWGPFPLSPLGLPVYDMAHNGVDKWVACGAYGRIYTRG